MGSSPIARSIFFRSFCPLLAPALFFFSFTFNLYAQVTTDFQRPFTQGQVIELPGTSEYLGDLSQEIEWESDSSHFHTMGGMVDQEVGWLPIPMGINGEQPQVLFEGIPYPFPSSSILSWLPVFQNFELLNFPASGWWGPSSTMGGVQIRLPETTTSKNAIGGWGNPSGLWGGAGSYVVPGFYLDSIFQHGLPKMGASADSFNFLLGSQLITDDSFEAHTGLLGAQLFGTDNWYSFFGSMKFKTPNFQSLELKPFVQAAKLNGTTVEEFGSDLNYHFTMGGVVESQLGFGLSHDDFSTGMTSQNKGYAQNLEIINVLDDFKLNMAFRTDFSSTMENMFSTTVGFQYRLGDFSILGSYSKAVEPFSLTDIQHGDFGFQYQPTDTFSTTFRFVTEMFENSWWTGGRAKIECNLSDDAFGIFRELELKVENQFLENSSGDVRFDTGDRIQFSFYRPLAFWFEGKGFSAQDFYTSGGIDCFITRQAKVYASIENLGNYPVSWPDLRAPEGRVAWLGIETGF